MSTLDKTPDKFSNSKRRESESGTSTPRRRISSFGSNASIGPDKVKALGLPRRASYDPSISRNSKKLLDNRRNDERERERNELKSKIDELEQFKRRYEDKTEENERLQRKVDQMFLNQSDAGQKLVKSNEILEKLRMENKKKSEQLEKNAKDMRSMEDRIRNLEIRASDVEKAELILETTKQNLEGKNQEVRSRESELRILSRTHDDTCKQLEITSSKLQEMDGKVRDLKNQVRHELTKNENIEKNLETIPKMKDDLREKDKELQSAYQDVEDKTAILAAARKSLREYRDKYRELEKTVSRTAMLEQELEIAQCEVATLKRLMQGKDGLVIQKSKALDLAKDVINTMKQSTDREQLDKIVLLLQKIASKPAQYASNGNLTESTIFETETYSNGGFMRTFPEPGHHRYRHSKTELHRDITVNRLPYPSDSEQQSQPHYRKRPVSGSLFSEPLLYDLYGSNDDLRSRTAVVKPTVKRTASLKESRSNSFVSKSSRNFSDSSSGKTTGLARSIDTSDSSPNSKANNNDDFRSSPRQAITPAWTGTTKSLDVSYYSDLSSISSEGEERPTSACVAKLQKLSYREKEDILKSMVEVGSRVLVSVAQKPPRYGKKIPPKPKIFTGIVKYIGKLDRNEYDSRTYVGLRLDDTTGDNDGKYRGKRYMYTPGDQGKFFKLIDVTSVLEVQNGKYRTISSILNRYVTESL